MIGVARSVREIQEITYEVTADAVRSALIAYLHDNHAGAFTPDTIITLHDDGSATVSTPYEKDDA